MLVELVGLSLLVGEIPAGSDETVCHREDGRRKQTKQKSGLRFTDKRSLSGSRMVDERLHFVELEDVTDLDFPAFQVFLALQQANTRDCRLASQLHGGLERE